MPRGPRLDAPGILHHVMARGVDRHRLFRDDLDRNDFVQRLATLATAEAWTVYAWTLIPNHFHLLVRTERRPLARNMPALLSGYATTFNRRHRRTGHLFQNRYKSIVCEDEPYFLELVRYLHLNPLRAGLVPDLATLATYPYSGHAVLLGRQPAPWQATAAVLGRFSTKPPQAQAQYQQFIAEGVAQGQRPDLQGGGLIRSAGGWAAVQALRRGREGYSGDERILGSSEFVEAIRYEADQQLAAPQRALSVDELIGRVCRALQVTRAHLQGRGRRPSISRARAGLAYLWIECLGQSGPALGRALGLRAPTLYEAALRGRQEAPYWKTLLEDPP